jgi:putative transposase
VRAGASKNRRSSIPSASGASRRPVAPQHGQTRDAFDNALAESFFATLETELLDRHSFHSRDEARLALFSYIEGFYNPRRRHSTLGYRSPDRFEEEMIRKEPQTAVAVSS